MLESLRLTRKLNSHVTGIEQAEERWDNLHSVVYISRRGNEITCDIYLVISGWEASLSWSGMRRMAVYMAYAVVDVMETCCLGEMSWQVSCLHSQRNVDESQLSNLSQRQMLLVSSNTIKIPSSCSIDVNTSKNSLVICVLAVMLSSCVWGFLASESCSPRGQSTFSLNLNLDLISPQLKDIPLPT